MHIDRPAQPRTSLPTTSQLLTSLQPSLNLPGLTYPLAFAFNVLTQLPARLVPSSLHSLGLSLNATSSETSHYPSKVGMPLLWDSEIVSFKSLFQFTFGFSVCSSKADTGPILLLLKLQCLVSDT